MTQLYFILSELIDPSIHQAIAPVNIIIRITFKTPTNSKNIIPCINPNKTDCTIFPALKPNFLQEVMY